MDMVPVKSSQLSAIGYDPDTQTLHIQFAGRTNKAGEAIPGSTYAYTDVPPEIHAALMAADADEKQSVGAHFGSRIKGGGFAYSKIS